MAISAHSLGPFSVNFVHPWLCLESESSMTHTLGLSWANQEQVICLQKMAQGHTRQDTQCTKNGVSLQQDASHFLLTSGPSEMPETLFSR